MKKPEILSEYEVRIWKCNKLGIDWKWATSSTVIVSLEDSKEAQRDHDWQGYKKATVEMLQLITEDFVEMIANFYVTDDSNRGATFDLWRQIEGRIQSQLKEAKE